MNFRFALRMIGRELRASRRRLALHMFSITLGVAALVAVNSFRANIERSVRQQARTVLGSDLELTRRQPFGDSVQALLDSTAAAGVPVSYRTGFGSMALAPRTGLTRLVRVRATEGTYPYYGAVETEPAGTWRTFRTGPNALLDPAVLVYLDIAVGDSIRLGDQTFMVAGTITNYPGRVSLEAAIGPRVYIPREYLAATNLIRRGSRAFYEANLAIPDPEELQLYIYHNEDLLERHDVDLDTVEETEEDLAYALDTLARFLGLVGLAALLLGGVGVASAIHVYVKSRLDTVAVLRCLGARQRTVFAIYLVQAAAMGLFGAAAGVLLGVGVQYALPPVLNDILPVDIDVQLYVPALFTGLGIGTAVALLFALFPLLTIRNTPPLRALRRAFDGPAKPLWRDLWSLAAGAALVGAVIGLSVWQAPQPVIGLAFAGAAAVGALVLWIAAVLLMRGTRRWFPSRARYVFRQGGRSPSDSGLAFSSSPRSSWCNAGSSISSR